MNLPVQFSLESGVWQPTEEHWPKHSVRSAVLLTAINSQLTDVGYTTAIEYGFYAFFALCLFCVIVGLLTERLHTRKNPDLANRFDLATRIIYPLATVIVFVCYYFRYH